MSLLFSKKGQCKSLFYVSAAENPGAGVTFCFLLCTFCSFWQEDRCDVASQHSALRAGGNGFNSEPAVDAHDSHSPPTKWELWVMGPRPEL